MNEYLRERIDEDELRDALGKFGQTTDTLRLPANNLERPDDAFRRTLPGELFERPDAAILKVDDRIKLRDAKQDVRDAATNASEKVEAKAEPTTDLAEAKNDAAEDAAEKPQEKLDKLTGDLATPEDTKTGAKKN